MILEEAVADVNELYVRLDKGLDDVSRFNRSGEALAV